jgi:hypothetical protein
MKRTRLRVVAALIVTVAVSVGLLRCAWCRPEGNGSDDLSKRAIATARSFLEKMRLPIVLGEVRVEPLRRSWRPEDGWDIAWVGAYRLKMTPDGSRVRAFQKHSRELAQHKGIGRTGRSIFGTEDEAKRFLTKVAKSLGLPRGARLSEFRATRRSTPGGRGYAWGGSASARFTVPPPDYPVLHGGGGMTVCVDPQDGALTFYHASWDSFAMPPSPAPAPRVTRDKAKRAARAIYAQHGPSRRRSAPVVTRARLGWVVPNAGFGSRFQRPGRRPQSLRLAWVVSFGSDEVFVDAYGGSVLGGLSMK